MLGRCLERAKERHVKFIATAVVYIILLAVVAVLSFFTVLVLVGPHAGILPSWLEPVVLVIGWLAVLVLPVLVARLVWRRYDRSEPPNNSLPARRP